MNSVFDSYQPFKGEITRRHTGSLVSFDTGEAVGYGIFKVQDRGTMFITPGVQVYEGMIVGWSPKSEDINVNVCKKKQLTNTRASGSDEALRLRARRLGVNLSFLSDFTAVPHPDFSHTLVVNYADLKPARLPETMALLAEIFSESD